MTISPTGGSDPIETWTKAFQEGKRLKLQDGKSPSIVSRWAGGSSLDELNNKIRDSITDKTTSKAVHSLFEAVHGRSAKLVGKRHFWLTRFFLWVRGKLDKVEDAIAQLGELLATLQLEELKLQEKEITLGIRDAACGTITEEQKKLILETLSNPKYMGGSPHQLAKHVISHIETLNLPETDALKQIKTAVRVDQELSCPNFNAGYANVTLSPFTTLQTLINDKASREDIEAHIEPYYVENASIWPQLQKIADQEYQKRESSAKIELFNQFRDLLDHGATDQQIFDFLEPYRVSNSPLYDELKNLQAVLITPKEVDTSIIPDDARYALQEAKNFGSLCDIGQYIANYGNNPRLMTLMGKVLWEYHLPTYQIYKAFHGIHYEMNDEDYTLLNDIRHDRITMPEGFKLAELPPTPPPEGLGPEPELLTTIICEQVTHETHTNSTLKIGRFDHADFANYLSQTTAPNASIVFDKILLEKTKELDGKPLSITVSKATQKPNYQAPLPQEQPSVAAGPGFYAYKEKATYVDFANESVLGGDWRAPSSIAQEEGMFITISKLALMSYLADKAEISEELLPKNEVPFYVDDCQLDGTLGDLYGRAFSRAKPDEIEEQVEAYQPSKGSFGVVGIAAKQWSGNGEAYTLDDLKHHFNLLYAAFMEHKRHYGTTVAIHSGKWGCGVFKGSVNTTIALHILASRATGVPLILHHIETPLHEVIEDCEELVAASKTIDEGLNKILNKQTIKAWRSQK